MSCAPQDFLNFAKALDLNGDEINRRNANSRAYYAAFHAVSQSIPDRLDPNSNRSHQDLQEAIERLSKQPGNGRLEANRLAQNLPLLKKARKQADYQLAADISVEQAQMVVERTRQCFADVSDLRRKRAG